MKLSQTMAQQIVKEMMNVISYNINVMDENGMIIGSGDPIRIGTIHKGAQKAIADRNIYEVYEDGEGMKPGVNEPIVMNNEIIGVVGITGHPDEVRPFSQLLKVTVALLIEQERSIRRVEDKRINKAKFYHELSYRQAPYDREFVDRARGYGLDLSKNTRVILLQGKIHGKGIRVALEHEPFWNLEDDKTVFYVTDTHKYTQLMEKLLTIEPTVKIGVGQEETLASRSLEQANGALEIGSKINPNQLINVYDDLQFLILLSQFTSRLGVDHYSVLEKSGDKLGLIETLQAYIAEDGDHNQTVASLNIHRNTLNYRLNRIKQLTGKDPRAFLDLFELLCGLIWR
ncbi:CdaR family transcriptional regulator [Paenibacillus glacialis]|uniref:Transcriptional regulator n=1 Tax=Paenibacillus glacialis TaxID=494026 RepID=A0A168JLQ3_9BACL|nr:sugar diacid recognition domain-containing protein [Paenibacillus glacialis]OAB40805.1 transcriptional regulator [Paenibacillus glacialis]